MNADPAELVGTVAGGVYRVVTLLGVGTMSAAYEVEHATGSRAALKVLLPSVENDPRIAARFTRESKAMAMFEHRNIVDVRDSGTLADGTPFIVTDLVEGVSLRDLIADGLVQPRRALAIARQILDALAHVHARGVIHRDIKPENVMRVDGGDPDADADLVKVLDFGIAKLLDDAMSVLGEQTLTQTGCGPIGTPLYMAPEPLLGRVVDARADLYAVGVVLFEMLVGRPPFEADDPVALFKLHASAPVPKLADAAPDHTFIPELELVIAESLAKKPEHRFRNATEMIAALDAAAHSLDLQDAIAGNIAHRTLHGLVPARPPADRAQLVARPQAGGHVRGSQARDREAAHDGRPPCARGASPREDSGQVHRTRGRGRDRAARDRDGAVTPRKHVERPGATRRPIPDATAVVLARARSSIFKVHDLSGAGARLVGSMPLAAGELIRITFAGQGASITLPAMVVRVDTMEAEQHAATVTFRDVSPAILHFLERLLEPRPRD